MFLNTHWSIFGLMLMALCSCVSMRDRHHMSRPHEPNSSFLNIRKHWWSICSCKITANKARFVLQLWAAYQDENAWLPGFACARDGHKYSSWPLWRCVVGEQRRCQTSALGLRVNDAFIARRIGLPKYIAHGYVTHGYVAHGFNQINVWLSVSSV